MRRFAAPREAAQPVPAKSAFMAPEPAPSRRASSEISVAGDLRDPDAINNHGRVGDDGASIAGSDASDDSVRTREAGPRVPSHRDLQWYDVASLVINKMIGTGIFTAPFTTMGYTRNRAVTITYWIIGFLYTILSMLLYLEYARDLPYTGGELVYLDHTWGRYHRLLAYTLYVFYFVILYSTCANSLQFAYHTLIAANADAVARIGSQTSAEAEALIDRRILCFIAFTVSSFICLLLYFSSTKSRYINAGTALAKVVLLFSVVVAGIVYISKHGANNTSWTQHIDADVEGWHNQALGWSQGLLTVFFSYHGWENATFVAGEIPRYNVLRKGFIVAVLVVGTFYVVLVAVYCAAFPADADLIPQFADYMAQFFGGATNGTAVRASAILTALSSAGSMLSVAYTAVRVKQVIGWTNILPLSTLWRRTDLSRRIRSLLPQSGIPSWTALLNQAIAVRQGTPEGGIILHFIFTVLAICITQAFSSLQLALTVTGSALIYGHFIFECAVGAGFALFFVPKTRAQRDIPVEDWDAPDPPQWFMANRVGPILLGGSTAIISLYIVAMDSAQGPGYWFLCLNGIIALSAVIYWYFFVRGKSQPTTYKAPLAMTLARQRHGRDDKNNAWRRCSLCVDDFVEHRHREDGYLDYNATSFSETSWGRGMDVAFGGLDDSEERYEWRPTLPAIGEVPMQGLSKRVVQQHARERGEASSSASSIPV